ncbi:MAG: hypothetical protein GY769_20765 [bacterium]|nr:hypothetical protein [bacterium]
MDDQEERELRYRCAVLQALISRGDTNPVSRGQDAQATLTAAGEILCHQAYLLARKMIEVEEAEAGNQVST